MARGQLGGALVGDEKTRRAWSARRASHRHELAE
jgi:hypothetical protein